MRPVLSNEEVRRVATLLGIDEQKGEEAVASYWAAHWWYNHAISFRDGDPIDSLPGVSVEKLRAIAKYFEDDHRSFLDQRP